MSTQPVSPTPTSLPLHIQRKRASTTGSLEFDHEMMADPPPPGKTPSDYHKARLQESLKYANSTLRTGERKLSPLGQRAVLIYKKAVMNLLELKEIPESEADEVTMAMTEQELVAVIRMHEESVQYKACLSATQSVDAQQLQNNLLHLKRIAFYARYGDVFAEPCKKLRKEAETRKVPEWESLVGAYWTDINTKLKQEEADWAEIMRSPYGKHPHKKCETHYAIHHACMSTGLNLEESILLIHCYAQRNELFHTNMKGLIKRGLFHDLAKGLHNDYCDIPRIFSAIQDSHTKLLSQLLKTTMDHWFTPNQFDPDNLQSWLPTDKLTAMRNEFAIKGDTGDMYKKQLQEITTEMAKRLRKEENAKHLAEGIEANFGLMDESRKVKRVASRDLEKEYKKAKVMAKDWGKLMGMAAGIRKLSEAYTENYGSLVRPPDEVVGDPTLDTVDDKEE